MTRGQSIADIEVYSVGNEGLALAAENDAVTRRAVRPVNADSHSSGTVLHIMFGSQNIDNEDSAGLPVRSTLIMLLLGIAHVQTAVITWMQVVNMEVAAGNASWDDVATVLQHSIPFLPRIFSGFVMLAVWATCTTTNLVGLRLGMTVNAIAVVLHSLSQFLYAMEIGSNSCSARLPVVNTSAGVLSAV